MGTIGRIFKFCFFILILALIFHNWTARTLFSVSLGRALGVPVSIASAQVDFLKTQVVYRDVLIHNPKGFGDGYVAKIPYVFLDIDRTAFFDGRFRAKKAEVEVDDFQVSRTADNQMNWMVLKPIREVLSQPAGLQMIPSGTPTDHFRLALRRSSYRDLTQPATAVRAYDVKLDADFSGISTVQDAAILICREGLRQMKMESFGGGMFSRPK